MEGDVIQCKLLCQVIGFQSTPSAWRETSVRAFRLDHQLISIHSLRMEGDHMGDGIVKINAISIHSLRMEGDPSCCIISASFRIFQSTPSAWRETVGGSTTQTNFIFQSTPSAWRETFPMRNDNLDCYHFNPLPPHGGRPAIADSANLE